jgi:hypothetical protein
MTLLRRLWGWVLAKPADHPPGARLTRIGAERIASAWAASAPLWRQPLASEFEVEDGRRVWVVTANAHARGATMWVIVDDASGEVIGHHERHSR